tara:strand:+ start:268 stop:918 length:651 start_codon:yes stop_codon:yes gene_type:complete
MKLIYIGFTFISFSGIAFWRERYGLHDPSKPKSDSIDSRVKQGNRILSLFHMITFLAGALHPLERENTRFMRLTFGSLSLIGSQIILQFILMILTEFYVQYDVQVSNKEKFKEDARTLIKQQDIQYKENSDSYLEIEILKNEISNHKEKILSLENKFEDVKYINSSLHSRLERISEKDSEKKKFLSELFNLIEAYKTLVPEGDYITMCNLLKNLYE